MWALNYQFFLKRHLELKGLGTNVSFQRCCIIQKLSIGYGSSDKCLKSQNQQPNILFLQMFSDIIFVIENISTPLHSVNSVYLINRPGVAWAVLQSRSLVIN